MSGFRHISKTSSALAVVLAVLAATPADAQMSGIQTATTRLMAGKAGAVVVVNVSSGKIMAKWRLDLAAQRRQPPGSAIKPFVLMELLGAGKVNPQQRLMCRRPLFVAGKRMDCSHPESVDTLDAADAIAYSCNSYFASVATRLDNDQLAATLRRAGFTSLTGLANNEIPGRVITPADPAHEQLQALGEWGIEVTPLELLAAYRNLALRKLHGENLGSAAPVFDGLERAVKYGMAHAAQPHNTTAAGKTGTAAGSRTVHTHGFFAGYAPAGKPEIAIVVYLENGRGLDAAAIAGKIFDAYWPSRSRP